MSFIILVLMLVVVLFAMYLAEKYSQKVRGEGIAKEQEEKRLKREQEYKEHESETLSMLSSIANNLTTKSCIEAIINDEKIVSISFQTKLSDSSKDYFHLMNIYLSENKEFLHFFQDGKKVYLKNINNIKYSTKFSFPTYIIEMPNGNEFVITPKIDDLFNLCIPYATEKQKEEFALILLQKLKEVLC